MQDINDEFSVENNQRNPELKKAVSNQKQDLSLQEPEEIDVNDYFKKFKSSNRDPATTNEETKGRIQQEIYEEDDEDEEEDDDVYVERQIKELTKVNHNTIPKKEQPRQKPNEASINENLDDNDKISDKNSEIINKMIREPESIKFREYPCAGDTTWNEDMNEDDILGMLNIDASSIPMPKKIEEVPIEANLGQKRKFNEIERDTIQLPQVQHRDKRYKNDYDEEAVIEFSRMINQGKNDKISCFDDIVIDLQLPQMEIDNFDDVYTNRDNYSKYYILSLIEMMRYEIEENYNNKRTKELPLVAASLELINKSAKAKSGVFQRNIKNLKKKSKEEMKAFKQKVNDKARKQMEKRRQKLKKKMENKEKGIEDDNDDSSNDVSDYEPHDGLPEDDQDEEEYNEESSEEEKDKSKEIYFLNIDEKEYSPDLKKDAQKDDLWIFMKERINSTQKIKDINDFLYVRTWWHGLGKSSRIKVKLIGNKADANLRLGEFKYAMRSTNISQYVNLINNLVNFRDAKPNKYLDSVLHISKTSFFEPLLVCEKNMVTQLKEKYSKEFNLNMDQD